ncbi:hypothetical protein [Alloscardovia macacae]|uniref:hypothetical protein n=1 Tax=Alloscardovia macacae TaxID=1160091 RepID=UPI0011D0D4DF|nr:hypothetical protein [Alloscardovia macacae]
MSTRIRQSLLKVGVGVLTVSLALGGLAYADTTPSTPNNNTGGGGSTNGNQGSGNYTSTVVWATNDNFGPANDATVLNVLTGTLGGKAWNDTNTHIHTATENALNECVNNYATRHNGDRNANCRVFGVGAVKSSDNTIANATGGHTEQTWRNAWNAEVGTKTYAHNGAVYKTNVPLNGGVDTINSLAYRETSGGNRSLVVIVLA